MNKTHRNHSSLRFASIAAILLAVGLTNASAFVLGPTTPGKWGPAAMGTGATVTWSLMATGVTNPNEAGAPPITALADFMPAGFLTEVQNAFAAWSAVANINFVFVAADNGVAVNAAGTNADIRIGGHAFDGAGGTLAHGFYPPANGNTIAGDIHFDTGDLWKLGFGGAGFSIFQVMAHEIGHAIGLDHTGVANSLMNPFYTEAFSGVQTDDIAGAQFIYGSRATNPPGVPDGGSTLMLLGLVAMVLVPLRRRLA